VNQRRTDVVQAHFGRGHRSTPGEAEPEEKTLGSDVAVGDGGTDFGDAITSERFEDQGHRFTADAALFAVSRDDDGIDVVDLIDDDRERHRDHSAGFRHEERVLVHDERQVVVDGFERLDGRFAFVVDRALVGVQHERCEFVTVASEHTAGRQLGRGGLEHDRRESELASRPRRRRLGVGGQRSEGEPHLRDIDTQHRLASLDPVVDPTACCVEATRSDVVGVDP